MFFQTTLFAGYLWAHVGGRWLLPRTQARGHTFLIVLAVATLFVWPLQAPTPDESLQQPQLWVLAWLLRTVGPAFVVLAATAPLLQRWWVGITNQPPYKLYALSNAGSLLALLSYPLWIEPLLALPVQASLWRTAYFGFAALVLVAGALAMRARETAALPPSFTPSWPQRVLWLSLSAAPSLLLVAVTNHITIDVASGPLLWVLPLGIYLFSFVLVFGPLASRGRSLFALLWVLCVLVLGINLFLAGKTGLWRQISVSLGLLLSGCLLCHGELVRLRPPATGLTSFYLWLSGGGALGGGLGALVAPLVLVGFFELQVAVLLVFGLMFVSHRQCAFDSKFRPRVPRVLFLGLGVGVPLMLATIWLGSTSRFKDAQVLWRQRGFFGLVQVTRFKDITALTHGRIRHGMQWNDPQKRREPTMYFARETAVGQALQNLKPNQPRRIVVLGLGAGTLATYARANDVFVFLEINPHMALAAQRHFSFLREAQGRVEVKVGDGRSLLRREGSGSVDALVLDAFSSDAVPTHLLTQEAFALYQRVLKPEGILVANVSNRHLAVERVVAGGAQRFGWTYKVFESASDPLRGSTLVRWVVAAAAESILDPLHLGTAQALRGEPLVWTDARSSVVSILR